MANLFGNLSTPQYESPTDLSLAASKGAGDAGQLFGAALRQKRGFEHDKEMAQNDPLIEMKRLQFKTQLAESASKLADSELSRRMKQNQIDSEAADKLAFTTLVTESKGDDNAFLEGLGKTFFKSAVGKGMATEARLSIVSRMTKSEMSADAADFTKRLAGLQARDRAAIRGMTPNESGGPSPMQWDALGLAEESGRVAKENERKRAEIEAISRGDQATTTITEKGVATTFKPVPVVKPEKGGEPQTKTLSDGTVLAWMPQGNAIHVIKGDTSKKLTSTQLLAIAKNLSDDDSRKQQILDAAADAAVKQVTPEPEPVKSAPTKALKYNPANGKIE